MTNGKSDSIVSSFVNVSINTIQDTASSASLGLQLCLRKFLLGFENGGTELSLSSHAGAVIRFLRVMPFNSHKVAPGLPVRDVAKNMKPLWKVKGFS